MTLLKKVIYMSQETLEKMEHIEMLLLVVRSKTNNFLGTEELSGEESKGIKLIREEIESGEYSTLDEVFGDSARS
jgi:hypothetical protein